jgi:hypothetical protein
MLALTFLPMETGNWHPKSTRSAAHLARIASFRPFAVAAGPHLRLEAFHFEYEAPAEAEADGNP